MDPNKSASAPPLAWADDKSPPPPYQESHHPGFPQPGPGYYSQPGPGYAPQPGPGYPHPAPGYSPHGQGYGPPPQYATAAAAGYGPLHPMGQQYAGLPVVVTHQPTVYVTRVPLAHPVNDYLFYSIFNLFCCLPLGITALIYSISTRVANHSGDQIGAERASRTARTLNHIGLALGFTLIVLSLVYVNVLVRML